MTIYESGNSNEKERRDDFRGNSEFLIEIDEIMMRMKYLYLFHSKMRYIRVFAVNKMQNDMIIMIITKQISDPSRK